MRKNTRIQENAILREEEHKYKENKGKITLHKKFNYKRRRRRIIYVVKRTVAIIDYVITNEEAVDKKRKILKQQDQLDTSQPKKLYREFGKDRYK